MKKLSYCFILLVLLISVFALFRGVQAEDGVTDTTIFIGIEGYTGSFSGDEENLGFQLYMKYLNEQGGIHDRKLQLRGYERKGGVQEALANAKRLAEEDKVFCLFNFGGMPLAMALTPYMMEKKYPISSLIREVTLWLGRDTSSLPIPSIKGKALSC